MGFYWGGGGADGRFLPEPRYPRHYPEVARIVRLLCCPFDAWGKVMLHRYLCYERNGYYCGAYWTEHLSSRCVLRLLQARNPHIKTVMRDGAHYALNRDLVQNWLIAYRPFSMAG